MTPRDLLSLALSLAFVVLLAWDGERDRAIARQQAAQGRQLAELSKAIVIGEAPGGYRWAAYRAPDGSETLLRLWRDE